MDLFSFKKLFLLLLLFFITVNGQEEIVTKKDSVYHLSEIIISANRYETNLLNTASSVTVLDSAEIASGRKTTVFDLLNNQFGLSLVQAGGPGKLTTINMRGANAPHTLVIIDGVEMNMPNDPSSTYDFSNLPLNNIKRIEILRGPQSTLYGSDAMAGVINIFTMEGLSSPRYFLNAEAGKYNTYSGSAGLSGRLNFFDYNIALTAMHTDGFSSASEKYGNTEKDGAENKTFSSKFGFWINDNIKVNLISRYTDAEADYDQFGGAFGDDPTYIFKMEETVIRPEIQGSFGIWNSTAGFSYFRNLRKYSFDSTIAYGSYSNSFYDGKKYKIDWLNNFKTSERVNFTVGVDIEKESAVSEYNEFNSLYSFESTFPQNEMNTAGAFFQNSIEPVKNAFFTWGLRYDSHNRFGSIVTYRIAPVYFFESTGTKFKATYGTGFKTPSLFNLFDPNFGNIDLKPEKSKGWDAGIEQFFINGNAALGITYFKTDYEDLFGSDELFRTININKAETEGIETYSSLKFSSELGLKFHYTYTRSIDKNPLLNKSEQKLIRRPEHKAGFGLSYQPSEPAVINLEFVYYGSRNDKDFSQFPAEIVKLSPFALLNASVSYKLLNYLEIYSRIENILNEEYEMVYGYATPGLAAYGGFRLNF
jgi:vitamin B12 transporter